MERADHRVSAPPFWDDLYARGQDGWDLGGSSPPLVAWLARGGRFPAGIGGEAARVAVPGCGRGHDVRLLARQGYRVTGFDFADAAIAEARALARADGVDAAFEQRDIFTLAADHDGAFDGLWEYTCFCAIDPGRREEYARVVQALLRPGGVLLGCFFPLREGTDGPPFPVSRSEVERVLAPGFDVLEAGPPAESVEQRRGLEWLVLARRRDPRGPAAR